LKFQVLAIGKLKTGPERELAADYQGRIDAIRKKSGVSALDVREYAESQLPTVEARMKAEADILWGAVLPGADVFVLDERGKAVSSEAFAGLIEQRLQRAVPAVSFLIGGPDGHAVETRARAAMMISFGAMTWPHRLTRVMLLEQLYRTLTILQRHPYHRA
jgi:23S rRNA (pseudouridine1915-N3)-methyltransferase